MAANTEKLTLPLKLANARMIGLGVGVLGLVGGLLVSLISGSGLELFWRGYIYGLVFLLGLWLGPLALLMVHHLTAGNWSFIIQRMLEAGTRTWIAPVVAIAILVGGQAIGVHGLYDGWANLDEPHQAVSFHEVVENKSFYLNVPSWVLRAGLYIGLWMVWILAYNNWSRKLDETGDVGYVVKMRRWAALGIIMYCLTMTFAATDWWMSLEPDWFSTMYGPLFWISQGLTTFAVFILILSALADHKPMSKYVTVDHYHMIGTFMMAFIIIWAYMSFSQYLIIWAGNLPEEITWYLARNTDGLNIVAVGLMLFHFFCPLMFLLIRANKFAIGRLKWMCFWILAWRLIDVFYIVNPSFHKAVGDRGIHAADVVVSVAMALGMCGIWLFLFLGQLTKSTAMPLNDPRLYDAMHHVPHPQEAAEHV